MFAFAAAFDGHGVEAGAVHFVTQALPSLVVLAVLAVAWRRQRLGAALFLALAIAYVVLAWGRFPLSTYLVIAGPMVLTAALFMADWKFRVGR